jgi:hypothetical protein
MMILIDYFGTFFLLVKLFDDNYQMVRLIYEKREIIGCHLDGIRLARCKNRK